MPKDCSIPMAPGCLYVASYAWKTKSESILSAKDALMPAMAVLWSEGSARAPPLLEPECGQPDSVIMTFLPPAMAESWVYSFSSHLPLFAAVLEVSKKP